MMFFFSKLKNFQIGILPTSILVAIATVAPKLLTIIITSYSKKNATVGVDIDAFANQPLPQGTNIVDFNFHSCARILRDMKQQLHSKEQAAQISRIYELVGMDNQAFCANLDQVDIKKDKHIIAISKSMLLGQYTQAELKAILAHEVSHVVLGHTTSALFAIQLSHQMSAVLFNVIPIQSMILLIKSAISNTWDKTELSKIAVVFMMSGIVNHFTSKYLRDIELEADKKSISLTRDPNALISALTKIENARQLEIETNIVQCTGSRELASRGARFFLDFVESRLSDHPCLETRSEALKKLEVF